MRIRIKFSTFTGRTKLTYEGINHTPYMIQRYMYVPFKHLFKFQDLNCEKAKLQRKSNSIPMLKILFHSIILILAPQLHKSIIPKYPKYNTKVFIISKLVLNVRNKALSSHGSKTFLKSHVVLKSQNQRSISLTILIHRHTNLIRTPSLLFFRVSFCRNRKISSQ